MTSKGNSVCRLCKADSARADESIRFTAKWEQFPFCVLPYHLLAGCEESILEGWCAVCRSHKPEIDCINSQFRVVWS